MNALIYLLYAAAGAGTAVLLQRTPSRLRELQVQLADHDQRIAALVTRQEENRDALRSLGRSQKELEERGGQWQQEFTALPGRVMAVDAERREQLQGLEQRLDAVESRNQELIAAFDGQLRQMQEFIVQAAEQARAQRQALEVRPVTPPAVTPGGNAAGVTAGVNDELAELLRQQQQVQRLFQQRRRQDEANFRLPNTNNGAAL